MTDAEKIASLNAMLHLMLDHVDYHTEGNQACQVNEMVGAVLPWQVIVDARNLLEKTK